MISPLPTSSANRTKAGRGEVADPRDVRPFRSAQLVNMKQSDRAAHDPLDEVLLRCGPRLQHVYQKPVAQNRRAIGYLHHFRNVVAHENNARAIRHDATDEREQLIDADTGQERRRLIKHQQSVGASRAKVLDRPNNGEQGLFRRGEAGNRRPRIEFQAVPGERLRHRIMFAPP